MTPNEQLHALLLAFNDSVKKLVHDAVESERSNLKFERERSQNLKAKIDDAICRAINKYYPGINLVGVSNATR